MGSGAVGRQGVPLSLVAHSSVLMRSCGFLTVSSTLVLIASSLKVVL